MEAGQNVPYEIKKRYGASYMRIVVLSYLYKPLNVIVAHGNILTEYVMSYVGHLPIPSFVVMDTAHKRITFFHEYH